MKPVVISIKSLVTTGFFFGILKGCKAGFITYSHCEWSSSVLHNINNAVG